jgi:hypothetical protein
MSASLAPITGSTTASVVVSTPVTSSVTVSVVTPPPIPKMSVVLPVYTPPKPVEVPKPQQKPGRPVTVKQGPIKRKQNIPSTRNKSRRPF